VLTSLATDAARLHQRQGQRPSSVLAVLALAAAHRILQQQQAL
jgi:hypothetical protein